MNHFWDSSSIFHYKDFSQSRIEAYATSGQSPTLSGVLGMPCWFKFKCFHWPGTSCKAKICDLQQCANAIFVPPFMLCDTTMKTIGHKMICDYIGFSELESTNECLLIQLSIFKKLIFCRYWLTEVTEKYCTDLFFFLYTVFSCPRLKTKNSWGKDRAYYRI